VRIDGTSPDYYSYLQDAYDAAGSTATIESHDVIFNESLNCNLDKTITFMGGYTCDYSSIAGPTTIIGNLTISGGTLIIQDGTLAVM